MLIVVMVCFAFVALTCISNTIERTKVRNPKLDFTLTVVYSMVSCASALISYNPDITDSVMF